MVSSIFLSHGSIEALLFLWVVFFGLPVLITTFIAHFLLRLTSFYKNVVQGFGRKLLFTLSVFLMSTLLWALIHMIIWR
jgi:hypothetical protein